VVAGTDVLAGSQWALGRERLLRRRDATIMVAEAAISTRYCAGAKR